jgi:hypothetical protein
MDFHSPTSARMVIRTMKKTQDLCTGLQTRAVACVEDTNRPRTNTSRTIKAKPRIEDAQGAEMKWNYPHITP